MFSYPDAANHECVQKLRSIHCPHGSARTAVQPFRLSVKSVSKRTTRPRIHKLTYFHASYEFHECDEDKAKVKGELMNTVLHNACVKNATLLAFLVVNLITKQHFTKIITFV